MPMAHGDSSEQQSMSPDRRYSRTRRRNMDRDAGSWDISGALERSMMRVGESVCSSIQRSVARNKTISLPRLDGAHNFKEWYDGVLTALMHAHDGPDGDAYQWITEAMGMASWSEIPPSKGALANLCKALKKALPEALQPDMHREITEAEAGALEAHGRNREPSTLSGRQALWIVRHRCLGGGDTITYELAAFMNLTYRKDLSLYF